MLSAPSAVFAVTMTIQFAGYFLKGIADYRGDPGARPPASGGPPARPPA